MIPTEERQRIALHAPAWVIDLAVQVADDHGRGFLPEIVWRRSKRGGCSGHAWAPGGAHPYTMKGRIVITSSRGSRRVDQKLTVLHELAHWLLPHKEAHSAAFWDKAFELYRQHRVPMLYAFQRERRYRKGAASAYRRNVSTQGEEEDTQRS